MKLKSVYFDLIKAGQKVFEGRLNDEKRQLISAGDSIVFKREPALEDSFNAVVKDLLFFDSFEKMASTLPLEKLGFANKTVNEVMEIYHQFYSVEDENKYGVVAIEVENIGN